MFFNEGKEMFQKLPLEKYICCLFFWCLYICNPQSQIKYLKSEIKDVMDFTSYWNSHSVVIGTHLHYFYCFQGRADESEQN